MKYIKRIKIHFLLAVSAMMILLSSCNKELEQFPTTPVTPATGLALGETIATIANDSLYYKFIVKGGMLTTINNRSLTFTMFVPDNVAVRNFINLISNGATVGYTDPQYTAFINSAAISATTAASIVSYNMIPQAITTASIPSTFPNWFYPTHLNPTTGTPGFNPLVRLTTSPSTRNGNWINNVPLSAVNTIVANGVIHTATAMVPAPPSRSLWARISADADMTYFKAAVQRADSGIAT
ncbi:MAG TPA: fasciclin domain-containing protein, partial [Ferruginibacter sp.]|nr:fasciclin domain-containing protein [Ferruginibacter sp.]